MSKMRRKDREIGDPEKINEMIRACHCCRLGFQDGEDVYIVPLNFGFEERDGKRIFYFHGAPEGRKIDLIRSKGRAGFELDRGFELKAGETACQYSASFQSVVGWGRVSMIEEAEERRHALRQLMSHYTGKENWKFPEPMMDRMGIFKLEVEEICCKEHE